MHVHSTAKLIEQIDTLTAKLDDCQAEKHALGLALAASVAYGRSEHGRAADAEEAMQAMEIHARQLQAMLDMANTQLRARITEVHTLNARLLIAQGGQL
jgi:hypothetical protein